jgi:hypothetical protein
LLLDDRPAEGKIIADGYGVVRRAHYLRAVAMTAAPIGWSFGFGNPLEPNLISRLTAIASMEETLNLAAAVNAYTLADRATWADFKNRRSLEILTEGDPTLFDSFDTSQPVRSPCRTSVCRKYSRHFRTLALWSQSL